MREGRARHHHPDRLQIVIDAQAAAGVGQAEPQLAAGALDQLGQGAIVDQRAAQGGEAADPLQDRPADQHAAAGGGRHRRRVVVGAGEGIEFLEEEDERGDQQLLPQAEAIEPRHQGDEVAAVCLGFGNQRTQGIGRVHDVGIAEEEEAGVGLALHRLRDALLLRPEFPRPARGQRLSGQHDRGVCRWLRGDRGSGLGRGGIGAAVIQQDDLHRPRIVLRHQTPQHGGDGLLLVARRDDGGDRRPLRQAGDAGWDEILIAAPEAAMKGEEIDPRQQRQKRQQPYDH